MGWNLEGTVGLGTDLVEAKNQGGGTEGVVSEVQCRQENKGGRHKNTGLV
jgi:hypothetical protein